MIKESWQSAIPNFSQFEDILSRAETIPPLSFLDLQPRLKLSIIRFDQLKNHSRFLLLNAPDNFIYRKMLTQSYNELIQRQEMNQVPIIMSDSIEPEDLFGQYQVKDKQMIYSCEGLLDKAEGGYLLISANLILTNPRVWPKLKSAILGDACSPLNADPNQILSVPKKHYDIKLVIIGDQIQLGDLELFDVDMHRQLCIFGEAELDIKITEETFHDYIGYVNGLIQQEHLPNFHDIPAWRSFLTQGARETEDQNRMPLCPIWHKALISEASIESKQHPISASHIQKAIAHKNYRQSYLPSRAIDDILDGQIIIETQGKRVGQVNGLTVIEVPGHPVIYGEPARISCVIHFGDGDIADVERKAELGGNLHAKGMMIMQAFLVSALNLNEPLPFAASIAFEQSYSEVDGDSASLAELCSLISALSESPINQEIAVTGAVDQFGRVQAVGGLNEKIEGFFTVCEHQGLTGNQGIILPKSNLKHLSLHQDVLNALKNKQFHLWSVESIDEAAPLIFGKFFRDKEEDTILKKISDRIENFEKHEINECGILDKIKNFFRIN